MRRELCEAAGVSGLGFKTIEIAGSRAAFPAESRGSHRVTMADVHAGCAFAGAALPEIDTLPSTVAPAEITARQRHAEPMRRVCRHRAGALLRYFQSSNCWVVLQHHKGRYDTEKLGAVGLGPRPIVLPENWTGS